MLYRLVKDNKIVEIISKVDVPNTECWACSFVLKEFGTNNYIAEELLAGIDIVEYIPG